MPETRDPAEKRTKSQRRFKTDELGVARPSMFATVAIFVATYAGVALGRVPGLRIDRAGISLVGASLMIAFGALSLEEAF